MQALIRHPGSVNAAPRTVSFAALAIASAVACAGQRPMGAAADGRGLAACAGLPEAVLASSPLEAPYEIEQIAPVHRFLWSGRGTRRVPVARSGKMAAVLITIQTPSWMMRDEMEMRLQCHITWMRSSDGGAPAMRSCPLGVPGASAEVRMGFGQRFTIAIQSDKESAANEVWRRASALVGPRQGTSEDEDQLE